MANIHTHTHTHTHTGKMFSMFQQRVYIFTVQTDLSTATSNKEGKVKEEAIHKGRRINGQCLQSLFSTINFKINK